MATRIITDNIRLASMNIKEIPRMKKLEILVPNANDGIVSLTANGSITTNYPIIPLGRYGDNNIHYIYIDIKDLLIEESKISQLLENYNVYLIFKYNNQVIYKQKTIDFLDTMVAFPILSTITANVGKYDMIFMIEEKTQGNIPDEIEVFTSAIIPGEVLPSMKDDFMSAIERVIIPVEGLLQKPVINFNWEKDDLIIDNNTTSLGYTQDRLITELKAEKHPLIKTLDSTKYYICFSNVTNHIAYKQLLTDYHTFLIPEITTLPDSWYVSVVIINDEQQLYSKEYIMEVLDNTLTSDAEKNNFFILNGGKVMKTKNNKIFKIREVI